MTAALLAAYTDAAGIGAIPPSPDDVFTTWPGSPDSIMRGTNASTPCTTPITLTPCTHFQSLTVVSHTFADGAPTPALLHSTWHAPNSSKVRFASASTDAASDTSVRTPITARRARRAPAVDAVERRLLDVGHDDAHAFGRERTARARGRCPTRRR